MKGEFNTKVKYAGFVRERGTGKVFDRAVFDGKVLNREGHEFVMTVHDDGSVDLQQVGDEDLTSQQKKVILDLIEDRGTSIRGDMHHYVDSIVFRDPEGGQKMLLRVTVKSPYAKLMDIFGEEEKESVVTVPDRLAGIFDEIMDESDEVSTDTEVSPVADDVPVLPVSDPTVSAFNRIKKEKAEELSRSLTKADQQVAKRRHELETATTLLKAAEDEAKVIADRVKTMGTKSVQNGFMVHVSEMTNEKVSLDEDTEQKIRSVVSKVKSIKLDNFMKLFNTGEYVISVFKDDNGVPVKVTDPLGLGEASSALSIIDAVFTGKDFVYRGDMEWHDIVDHFVCRGFNHMTRLPDSEKEDKKEQE
jgi:hypothetical protein